VAREAALVAVEAVALVEEEVELQEALEEAYTPRGG